jgi:signal transduction histidine kinase
MTEETIKRAFEPCFTTKPDGLGGLGLPMTELFARRAGGRILVESSLGAGTIMRLQIPVAHEQARSTDN